MYEEDFLNERDRSLVENEFDVRTRQMMRAFGGTLGSFEELVNGLVKMLGLKRWLEFLEFVHADTDDRWFSPNRDVKEMNRDGLDEGLNCEVCGYRVEDLGDEENTKKIGDEYRDDDEGPRKIDVEWTCPKCVTVSKFFMLLDV